MKTPGIIRFCKKHGYIECKCPESMGLSVEEFKKMKRVIREARLAVDDYFSGDMPNEMYPPMESLRYSLARLDSLRGGR